MKEELYDWLCSFYRWQYANADNSYRDVPYSVWMAVSHLVEIVRLMDDEPKEMEE